MKNDKLKSILHLERKIKKLDNIIENLIQDNIKLKEEYNKNKIMRIKIEDYHGNDIVELNVKKLDDNKHIDIIETDEYNIADVDEDENGEYVRVQLTESKIRTTNTID